MALAVASSCSSDLTSSLGTCIGCRCSPKQAKKKKGKKKIRIPMKLLYKSEKGNQICAFERLLYVPWKRPELGIWLGGICSN